MHPRMIRTIFDKDLRDAIRDARVLFAILFPIALGLFYDATAPDEDPTVPRYRAVVATDGQTDFPQALLEVAGQGIVLTVDQVADQAEVERRVAAGDDDLGLVLPPGFDAAVRAATGGGAPPSITVREPDDPTPGTYYLLAALDPALRVLADQRLPATIEVDTAVVDPADLDILGRVGLNHYLVLGTVMLLIGMTAMLVVPIILAEEAEKKTLDALVMIASHTDVVVGKALVGLTYVVVAVSLLLGVTRIRPDDLLAFGAALVLLSVALIGFGLLLGSVFRNANQLNTWSGVFILPVLTPVFLVGLSEPGWLVRLLDVLPTSQGTRLAINGLTGEAIFADAWLSYLVIAVWGVVAYALLAWQLRRREA